MERKVKAHRENQQDASRWTGIIKRYTDVTELDDAMLLALVDRIEVGETKRVHGVKVCDVKVYYRYVGNVDDALIQERQVQYEQAV